MREGANNPQRSSLANGLAPVSLRTRVATTLAWAIALLLLAAPPAQASFGISSFEAEAITEGGASATLAGSHPYQLTTKIALNLGGELPGRPGVPRSDGDLRDLTIEEPPGLIENPDVVPECTQAQFNTPRSSSFEEPSLSGESCPANTQVGVVRVSSSFGGGSARSFGVFNLVPPPGVPSQLGFAPFGTPIALDSQIRGVEGGYGLTLQAQNLPQRLDLYGLEMTLWGTPWGVSHNGERGNCLNEAEPGFPWAKCSVGPPKDSLPKAYLTMPTSCNGPLVFTASADSWQQSATVSAGAEAPGLEGCEALGFNPRPVGQLTDSRASSASGYEFDLTANNEALSNPSERVASQAKNAVVALPAGVTLNPSVGAGLGVCTPAQYDSETASTPPGAGCPNDSKIGDFSVQSPLYEETVGGSIFLAAPRENPFDSLLALYLVAKAPERGILVKVAGRLSADPTTGNLIATFDDLPQLPYTDLAVHFRESQRAPLVTPSACGAANTQIELTPWQGALASLDRTYLSQISAGSGGGACPSGTTPPFQPGVKGGTLNVNAGSYSPFYLRLTRTDTEQEITSYSAKLPPGLLGKIAGIPYCPEADIEAAKRDTGVGEEEHPSCPASSEIGHTVSGYGVGSTLAYAPGRLYLAGPYHGSSFSVVAIDSATVGPFDLGVIVVRSAVKVNPDSAQVSIDSTGSDPIPHILDGIPIHLRDIRVYLSRPELMINPTSCEPFSLTSTLTGSSEPFTNPDDIVASLSDHFQAFYCSSLGFAPRLDLKLKGGTKRGDYPTLHVTVMPRPGDADIGSAAVTLPPSLFLAQEHIRRPCAKPEFEAEACPAESVYGHVTAVTPLLGEPMTGPVYLRSAPENASGLPDLVAVLHAQGIHIVLDGKIDTNHGGIRATFEGLPDAPVTRFEMTINGGRKRGILQDSANLCGAPQLAIARFVGQNNKGEALRPQIGVRCSKRKKRNHRGGK